MSSPGGIKGHAIEAGGYLKALGIWSARNPASAFLLAAALAALTYFFGFLPLYANATQPVLTWAWLRFLPQYNQEHSKIIPLVVLFLVWYHRDKIKAAPVKGSNLGLFFIGLGLASYVVAARALQPRVALLGLPVLVFGIVLYVWGREIARILMFPIGLLVFMIPMGALEQTTFRLQFLIIGFVKFLSNIFGIGIYTVGTSIRPISNEWGFEIAEGCSGIRSLIAMIMITAIYAHLREPKLWKKMALLAASILFAVVGNAGRVFTIIVLGKLGFPTFAGGVYHDWSSQLIFFPIALACMLGFHKLLNLNYRRIFRRGALKEKEAVVYDY